jgi:hypothetical protein
LSIHFDTPPCRLQAPVCVGECEYVPSLHCAMAPAAFVRSSTVDLAAVLGDVVVGAGRDVVVGAGAAAETGGVTLVRVGAALVTAAGAAGGGDAGVALALAFNTPP